MASIRPANPWLLDHPPILLGRGGMLHRAWNLLLNRWGIPHQNLGESDLDLTRPERIESFLDPAARLVINCAAYTDVDGAETDEALATLVNGTAVGALARVCQKRGAWLAHYSTDYVFDGRKNCPYFPTDPRAPINAYGRSKLAGEKRLQESGCRYLLLRTSWLYAPWGKNFVKTMVRFAGENRPLKIVHDQRGRPTSAEHLAAASLQLIELNATGLYHVTDGGDCTWFEFARHITSLVNPSCTVTPWTTAELNRPAPRPAYSVLDLTLTEQVLGAMPDWKANVADVIPRLES
jgi:dTDP-4-dehydrorhamnose reductase